MFRPLTTKICQQQVEQPSSLSEILLEDDCIYSRGEVSLNHLSICFVLFFLLKLCLLVCVCVRSVQLKDMLEMIHEGNKTQGGLQRINTGFGILGFVRFLDCYYLILVTQRRKVSSTTTTTTTTTT
jgi:hypothetical protein